MFSSTRKGDHDPNTLGTNRTQSLLTLDIRGGGKKLTCRSLEGDSKLKQWRRFGSYGTDYITNYVISYYCKHLCWTVTISLVFRNNKITSLH